MQTASTEKRNVGLLAASQALFQTASVMVMTIAGLVGLQMAPDKSLATLPIAMMMVAAAAGMIPAALLMQRWGRKAGFMLGALLGVLAGIAGAGAIWLNHFGLFVVANMLVGGYQAFAQYYRFAAADVASGPFKSKAISWVIAGGVVAAIAGPNIARFTQQIGSVPFAAAYLSLSVLALAAFLLAPLLQIPPANLSEAQGQARPLKEILLQPVFLTALAGSTIGYAMMVMVMTATPLAMQICGQPLANSATVIQWHVLGMFVPSFFTGKLILRFGVLRIMASGALLLGAHVAIALSGNDFANFISGLTLLGIGWNFLFIGGTSLLTHAYRPSERAKAQAAHDFLMFAAISLASLVAGSLLNSLGWRAVNLSVLPFLALILLMLFKYGQKQRQTLAA